ncbi:MAG: hypothetical protein ACRD2U_06610 [Terriglobales bacterium]
MTELFCRSAVAGLVVISGMTSVGAQTLPPPPPPTTIASGAPAAPAASDTPSSATQPVRKAPEDYDPLLDPPPLPHSTITLIGGTVTEVDQIQNRLTVKPFGGKQRMHLNFDVRTHIFQGGQIASERDLRRGERVYLDTMLNGSKVFAKNIWIRGASGNGNGRGQIVRYDSRNDILTVRDEVSTEPVSFHLDSGTVIRNGEKTGSVEDLKPGSLVAVTFDPGQGRSGMAREISILAEPGSRFTFMGRITFVDLSERKIAVSNQSDDKSYDVYFDSLPSSVLQGLREGSQASILAVFDGSRYVAQKVDVIPGGQAGIEEK